MLTQLPKHEFTCSLWFLESPQGFITLPRCIWRVYFILYSRLVKRCTVVATWPILILLSKEYAYPSMCWFLFTRHICVLHYCSWKNASDVQCKIFYLWGGISLIFYLMYKICFAIYYRKLSLSTSENRKMSFLWCYIF